MKDTYTRLCGHDRRVIANMKQAGKTQMAIAQAVGCSQGTVSKELRRNRGQRNYRPRQADRLARERQAEKPGRPRAIVGVVQAEVEARLRQKHSPEQISNSLALSGLQVSHETIYQHVARDKKAGGDLASNLRINGRRRYRRRCKTGRQDKIPDRVDIDLRPPVVESRERFGDWEADLIQGGGGSGFIVSLYERKSRLGMLHLMPDKSSDGTFKGIVTQLLEIQVRTITYDNGLEFARHGLINEVLGCESFFCKPYHSWEKGGVENYNGLVRQYFPKGHDFRTITAERLQEVQEEINGRPRKVHGYLPPIDFLDDLSRPGHSAGEPASRSCEIPLQDSLRSPFRSISQDRENPEPASHQNQADDPRSANIR